MTKGITIQLLELEGQKDLILTIKIYRILLDIDINLMIIISRNIDYLVIYLK